MSFLDNQTYKKYLKFVNNLDDEKKVGINIILNTNHEIDKNLINEIENTVNNLLLSNYDKEETYLIRKQQEKEQEKQKKENDRLYQKTLQEQERLRKEQERLRKEQEKLRKEQEKQHNKANKQYKGIRLL
jgi:predicted nucleic acid-binding protein